MPFADDRIRQLWASSSPRLWQGEYWMVSYAPTAWAELAPLIAELSTSSHYASAILDGHEIAAIIPSSVWDRHRPLKHHRGEFGPLSCITFDVPLDIEVFGYLAPVVDALAKAQISIVPQCALVYDHILVHQRDAERAVVVIRALSEAATQ